MYVSGMFASKETIHIIYIYMPLLIFSMWIFYENLYLLILISSFAVVIRPISHLTVSYNIKLSPLGMDWHQLTCTCLLKTKSCNNYNQ